MSAPIVITAHWRQRVRERIGGNVCPDLLAEALFWAIDNHRRDLVDYLGRVRSDGVRAWRFRVTDGRLFVALIDSGDRHVITVLPPGAVVRGAGGVIAHVDPAAPPQYRPPQGPPATARKTRGPR